LRFRLVALVAALSAAAAVSALPAQAGRLQPSERKEINTLIDRFVVLAVKRERPEAAWSLVTPEFRAGTTRSDWARGDSPAYPYPARGRTFHRWHLVWADRNDIGIDLILQPVPRKRKQIGPIVFGLDLKRIHGRWLVDSFLPQATFAPEGQTPRMFSERDVAPSGGGAPTAPPRVDDRWGVFALALLLLIPVTAIALWVLIVAVQRHRAGGLRQRRSVMPSLPGRTQRRFTAGK
jgi:hypothetical protein